MAQELISSRNGLKTPVLLLKTKSSPTDAYEDLFSTPRDDFHFEPTFIPVLQHRFDDDGMKSVRELLQKRRINGGENSDYGGLIFTSQRAVEAFAKLVDEGQGMSIALSVLSDDDWGSANSDLT
jgi:uroporphyrinogen-III synthase